LFGAGAGPEWDTLRTTWGPNPLSSSYFVKQPLTIAEAREAGFEQFSTGCEGEFIYSIVFYLKEKLFCRKISWTTFHSRSRFQFNFNL